MHLPPLTFCTYRLPVWLGLLGCWLLSAGEPARAQSEPDTERRKLREKVTTSGLTTLARAGQEAQFAEGMRYLMTDEPTKAIAEFDKLLQRDPNNAAALYATATALLKAGKLNEALPFATKAYQLDNQNKYFTLLLAELHVKQKRYAEAEALYEALIQRSPENSEYGVELAAIYLFDDKPDKALAAYERVEQALGLNEEIIRQKQRIYLKQNRVDKAIEEAEKLIQAEPGDPDYLIEGAELLISNDRVDQAVSWLERALKLSPDSPQAHMLLADVYRKQGNLEKSSQELKYVFANPNLEAGVKARILSSYVTIAGEDASARQDALRLAQELVKAHPTDAKAQVMLADLLMQQGQKAEARNAYVRAANADPSIYEVWGAILQLDGELMQIDSLIAHSERALEVFPTQGHFWYANGSAHLYKRNYQQAIDALDESRKLLGSEPKMLPEIYGQLGDAYNGLGDYAKSDVAYEEALKLEPNNDRILNNYSYFLSLRRQHLPKARQMAEALVRRHPNNATYLDTYAWVLYVSGDYAKARQQLEKALQAEPSRVSGTILEHYGDVLFQLGDSAQALEQWKKARAKGGANDRLEKKIATGKLHE